MKQPLDLLNALKSKIGGLFIERSAFPPKYPLILFPQVVFSPMLGSHSIEGQFDYATQAVDLASNWIKNGILENEVMFQMHSFHE